MSGATIVAGWYADPAGIEALRYWDGDAWTTSVRSEVMPAPVIAAPEPSVAAPVPRPAPAGASPFSRVGYVPMAGHSGAFADRIGAYRRSRVFTPAGWWLALSPVWISIVQVVLGLTVSETSPIALVVLVAMTLLSAALTVRDRGILLYSGVSDAASAWWWLLTPFVYLLVRAFRVGGAGWVLPVVYLLGLPAVAIVVVVAFSALYAVPLG